jgi:hypothetical protein
VHRKRLFQPTRDLSAIGVGVCEHIEPHPFTGVCTAHGMPFVFHEMASGDLRRDINRLQKHECGFLEGALSSHLG